jgi:thioredoxin 1
MPIKQLTNDNFDAEVLSSSRPVLVEFFAPWCVYCKRLAPVLERMAASPEAVFDIGQVNVEEQADLEDKYRIELVPTLFLFQNGQPGEKLIAPSSQAKIEEWIKSQTQAE